MELAGQLYMKVASNNTAVQGLKCFEEGYRDLDGWAERQTYERHKEKARQSDKYLCICIDGMDQSKTAIPHVTRQDKTTSHLWSLHTHVTGALTHGTMDFGKHAIAFINTSDLPSDSNLTLNVLMETLNTYASKNGKLPEVLYLQFDNCWRENKNMFILGFCYLLVALGIVKKVRLNFLIVGHTHNDVDQIFSRIAEALRRLVAHTMDELEEVICNSYERPPVNTVILNHLYDFKKWLQPHFAGQFCNHSVPHNFRIKKINGSTILQYRKYTGDRWEPKEGLHCLKTLPSLSEIPPWVNPNLDKLDVYMLQQDIPKFFYRMREGDRQWWTKYLSDLNKMKEIPEKPDHWPMMTLLATREDIEQEAEDLESEVTLPDNLRTVWQRVNKPMKAVTIGSQGKPNRKKQKQVSAHNEIEAENPNEVDESTVNGSEDQCQIEHESPDIEDENDMNQFSTISPGTMVALYVEWHWDASPQIAKVLDIDLDKETVLVHWFAASWSGRCAPLYTGGGANREPKTELLDIRCILLWQFSLTSRKEALKSATVIKLKAQYREIGLEI